jgi:hypothetical protein
MQLAAQWRWGQSGYRYSVFLCWLHVPVKGDTASLPSVRYSRHHCIQMQSYLQQQQQQQQKRAGTDRLGTSDASSLLPWPRSRLVMTCSYDVHRSVAVKLLDAATVSSVLSASSAGLLLSSLSFCIVTMSTQESGDVDKHSPTYCARLPHPRPLAATERTLSQLRIKTVPPPTVAAVGQTPAGPGTSTAPSCDREGSLPLPLLPLACAAPRLGGACWVPTCPLCGSGAAAAAHSHGQHQRHSLQGGGG